MNKLTTELLEKFVSDIKTDGMCDITDHQVESALIQLLAYEQAAKNPIAFTEACEISNMNATGLYMRGFPDSKQGRNIPIYAAPVLPKQPVKPVMFIDGDISSDDAEKLAAVIREFALDEVTEAQLVIPEQNKFRDLSQPVDPQISEYEKALQNEQQNIPENIPTAHSAYISFDALMAAVSEVTGVKREFDATPEKGYQAVPFMNFNSLSRIVEMFRTAQPNQLSMTSERELFKAWNNDIDCPIAGLEPSNAAWRAWISRAAIAPAQPAQPVITERRQMVPDEIMPSGLVYSSALPKFESNDSDKVVGYSCWVHGDTRLAPTQEQAYSDAMLVVSACRAAFVSTAQSVIPEQPELVMKHSSVIAEQLAHVLSGMDVNSHNAHQRAVISCAIYKLNKTAEILQQKPTALIAPERLDYQSAKELFNYLMNEEETNATVNGWNACRDEMLKAQQNEPQNIPENIPAQPVSELRARAISLYKPPFKFDFGYIWDADGQMVADQKLNEDGQILRVRGWGRISYLENPEALQDEVGEIIAIALSDYWNRNIEAAPAQESE